MPVPTPYATGNLVDLITDSVHDGIETDGPPVNLEPSVVEAVLINLIALYQHLGRNPDSVTLRQVGRDAGILDASGRWI